MKHQASSGLHCDHPTDVEMLRTKSRICLHPTPSQGHLVCVISPASAININALSKARSTAPAFSSTALRVCLTACVHVTREEESNKASRDTNLCRIWQSSCQLSQSCRDTGIKMRTEAQSQADTNTERHVERRERRWRLSVSTVAWLLVVVGGWAVSSLFI